MKHSALTIYLVPSAASHRLAFILSTFMSVMLIYANDDTTYDYTYCVNKL